MLGSTNWRPPSTTLSMCGIIGTTLLLFPGCADFALEAKVGQRTTPVTVLAASSTTEVLDRVAQSFEELRPEIDIRISSGPSNSLARQIISGAPADLFISANQRWADVIVDAGMTSQVAELFRNELVLVVPAGNPAGISQPSDLIGHLVERVAVAGETVPAGIYARQALQQLGLLGTLRQEGRLTDGSSVRVALAYVERGEVDAAIVYATDAKLSSQIEVITVFEPQTHDAILYPVVLLKGKGGTPAQDFFEYLQSDESRATFGRFGFSPVPSQS